MNERVIKMINIGKVIVRTTLGPNRPITRNTIFVASQLSGKGENVVDTVI